MHGKLDEKIKSIAFLCITTLWKNCRSIELQNLLQHSPKAWLIRIFFRLQITKTYLTILSKYIMRWGEPQHCCNGSFIIIYTIETSEKYSVSSDINKFKQLDISWWTKREKIDEHEISITISFTGTDSRRVDVLTLKLQAERFLLPSKQNEIDSRMYSLVVIVRWLPQGNLHLVSLPAPFEIFSDKENILRWTNSLVE